MPLQGCGLPLRAPVGFRRTRWDAAEGAYGKVAVAIQAQHSIAKQAVLRGEAVVAVEIGNSPSQRSRAHEGVQRLVEEDADSAFHLMGEMAAERAFFRRRIVRRTDLG